MIKVNLIAQSNKIMKVSENICQCLFILITTIK